MPKIVPTGMLKSTFEEPSRGSKTSKYLPMGYWSGMGRNSAFSSEARPASRPVWSVSRATVRSAKRSSFMTVSPWTLTSSVRPRISASPARVVLLAMTFPARARS